MICFVPFTSTLSAEPRRRWVRVIVKAAALEPHHIRGGCFIFYFFQMHASGVRMRFTEADVTCFAFLQRLSGF